MIAILPVYLHAFTMYNQNGVIDINKIASSGELFWVSIVTLSEPLVEIIVSKKKNITSLFLSILIVINLILCAYCYSQAEMPMESLICKEDYYKRFEIESFIFLVCAFILGGATIIHVYIQDEKTHKS